MTNFEHDYLVMDEFGRKELKCMASGKTVAARIERESEKFKGKTSFDFMKYADYREIPFWLNDNSIAFLIFCDEQKEVVVGEEEAKKLSDQLRRARRLELTYSGKTSDFIEMHMEKFEKKLPVLRKLTGEEIRQKLCNYKGDE